jgi:putative chitinase
MIDRKKFFDGIKGSPMPTKLNAGQVKGITAILDEWERRKLTDLRWLADMLATDFHETAFTMQPVTEYGSQKYLRAKKYWPWIGRGLVQLTWKPNYVDMQKRLKAAGFGVDIVANPDDALRLDVAVFIMFEGMIRGTFTGKKLSDYFNAKTTDWKNARRIINGTDRADEIATYAKQFFADLIVASK